MSSLWDLLLILWALLAGNLCAYGIMTIARKLKHPKAKPRLLIFVDTETGGLDAARNALLTVGIVVAQGDTVREDLHIMIQPEGYRVDQTALEVNHIDLLKHNKTAISRAQAAALLSNFFNRYASEKPYLVGHNLHFDMGFLNELFNSTQMKIPYGHRTMDTASNAIFLKTLGHDTGTSLPSLIKFYKVPCNEQNLHNALVDANVTRLVFRAQVEHMERMFRGEN